MNGITNDPDQLYELLPAIYRERDEAEGYPLRALLQIIAEQVEVLHTNNYQLWDNFFIETCEQWAIPYIADLVGNNLLHDSSRVRISDKAQELFGELVGRDLRADIATRTRTDVAKTIYYRRRKGTPPMLEELARDVTRWAAHVVEFFQLLGWTQNLNHLRLFNHDCPDIRRLEPIDRLDGPFDTISHTVDVRQIQQNQGWYNIRNIGFFLWRLQSYPLENTKARRASQPWQYHFSPLGNRTPLFTRLRREGDETGMATELHVPGPIRPALFHDDLTRHQSLSSPRPDHTDLYGLFEAYSGSPMVPCPQCSFVVILNGIPVSPENIGCRDLKEWIRPDARIVGVDVCNGRIAFGTAYEPVETVDVYYHYGFSADLGGGTYDRRKWLVRRGLAGLHLIVQENGPPAETFQTIGDALQEWISRGKPNTIITIADNRTYEEPIRIELADNRWLVIEAENMKRPHLQPDGRVIQVNGNHTGAGFTLSGLLVEGGVHVTGDMGRLKLLHTTLVPGRSLGEDGDPQTRDPGIIVENTFAGKPINASLRVEIAFSITGSIRMPENAVGLWALDSIVDGLDGAAISASDSTDLPGPPLSLERVTVFGNVTVKEVLMASEVIFTKQLIVMRRQKGCVRFSYVHADSDTPRRHRCQPDLEIGTQIENADKEAQAINAVLIQTERDRIQKEVAGWLAPSFTSIHYGDPGYAQLGLGCPEQIRKGAEDESEMGVFNHLKQSQRETNLRIRLEEYLPFGLDPGIIYIT